MSQSETNDPYVLISADCHAGARISGYREFLDPAYRERFDLWREQYRNPARSHLGKKKDLTWGGSERVSGASIPAMTAIEFPVPRWDG